MDKKDIDLCRDLAQKIHDDINEFLSINEANNAIVMGSMVIVLTYIMMNFYDDKKPRRTSIASLLDMVKSNLKICEKSIELENKDDQRKH